MRKRFPDDVLNYFRKEGARGGKIAGQSMTAEERKARATKGSQAAALVRSAKKRAKAKKARG